MNRSRCFQLRFPPNHHCPRMNSCGNALGFLHAVTVAREPHGILRRNIDNRCADWDRFILRRAVGRQPSVCVLFIIDLRVASDGCRPAARLFVFGKDFVEGNSIHQVRQRRRVFVDPAEVAIVDEEAVGPRAIIDNPGMCERTLPHSPKRPEFLGRDCDLVLLQPAFFQ